MSGAVSKRSRCFYQWACLLALLCFATGNNAVAQDASKQERKQRVYVPIEDLDAVLKNDGKGVLLSVEEFEELYKKAAANRAAAFRQPAAVVITSGEYNATISGDHLIIVATIQFQQFVDGWQSISMPLRGLSIEKAQVGNEPARLGRRTLQHQNQTIDVLELLNDKAGSFTLELTMSTQLAAVGSDQVAAFGVILCPSAKFNVTVPAKKHLLVNGLSIDRPADIDQPAAYSVAAGGLRDLRLVITERQSQRTTDSLLFASTGFGLNVAPGEVTWQAVTSVQVYGTRIDRLTFFVPSSLEIADVQSTGLEAWELSDRDGNPDFTQIQLDYRQPFDGNRKVIFKGVMTTPSGAAWSVPTLELSNATSHIGRVLVQHPPGVRLRVIDNTGVRQVQVANSPASLTPDRDAPAAGNVSRPSLVYNAWRENFSLSFVTQTKRRELQTSISTILDINSAGLDVISIATLEAYFAPLFELDITLPAEWTITGITFRGKPIQWQTLPQEAGIHQVRLSLKPALAIGEAGQLTIAAHRDLENWPIEDDPVDVAIPRIVLPQSNVVEGTFVVKAEPDLDVTPQEVVGLDPANIKVEGQRLGYRYQDSNYQGAIRIQRKASRLFSRTVAISRLDRTAFHTYLESDITIEGGKIRTIKLAVSESAGEDIRFRLLSSLSRIVEQQAGEVVNGERLWTLQLDQRRSGLLRVAVDVTSPVDEQENFVPHQLRVVGAERQNGFIAFEAAGDQQIQVQAVNAGDRALDDVDPVDLPNVSYTPRERIVAVYRYLTGGYKVSLSEVRFDRVAVPTAVGYDSHITSIFGRMGDIQNQAKFEFVAIGVQSLRVVLPTSETTSKNETPELWAALVDDQPVEIRRTKDAYLVPLPAIGRPDAQRCLELFYRTQAVPLHGTGKIEQQPPSLSAINGKGVEQPIELLDQTWSVYYPQDTLLTENTSVYTAHDSMDRASVLGQAQQLIRVGSLNLVLQQSLLVAVIMGIVAVMTMAYRRRGFWGFGAATAVLLLIGFSWFGMQTRVSRPEALVSQYANEDPQLTTGMMLAESEAGMAGDYESEDYAESGEGATEMSEPMFDDRADREMKTESEAPIVATDPASGPPQTAATSPAPLTPPSPGSPPPPTEVERSREIQKGQRNWNALDEVEQSAIPFATRPQNRAAQPSNSPTKTDNLAERIPSPDEPQMAQNEGDIAGDFISGLGEDELNGHLGMEGRGARLSLALSLQPPAGSHFKQFRYSGTESGNQRVALSLRFDDWTSRRTWLSLIIAGIALVFWCLRSCSVTCRTVLAAVGFVIPLSLITVAPDQWHVLLDGIFFGSLVGIGCWLLSPVLGLCNAIRLRVARLIIGSATTAALIAVCFFAQTGEVHAQRQQAKAPAKKPSVSTVRPDSIIVPYDPAQGANSAKHIFVPHQEFIRLWNEANPDQPLDPAKPRLSGSIANALYSAKLVPNEDGSSGSVEVSARFLLHNHTNDSIKLTLPLGRVALTSAKLNDEAAPLLTRVEKGVSLDVVLQTTGAHVLDLQFAVPAKLTGPAGQFQIPLGRVASGKLEFTLPNNDLNVRVNGSSTAFRVTSRDQASIIEVPIDGGGLLSVAWQPKQTRGAVDGIIHVESAMAALIDDAGIRMRTSHHFNVPQGSMSDAEFTLPENVNVQAIVGPDVGGWQLNEEGQRSIRVFFRRAIEDQTSLSFDLYADQKLQEAQTNFTLPSFEPLRVTREIGVVGVFTGPQFGGRSGQTSGVSQINAAQFKPKIALKLPKQAPVVAYRYTARPISIPLVITRRAPQSTSASQHASSVELRKIRIASRFRVRLTQAPRSSFSLRLANGYLPVSVTASDLNDWYFTPSADGDGQILTVEFSQPRLGLAEIAVEGVIPKAPNEVTANIAVPNALEVSKASSTLAVWVDSAYSATLGSSPGWRPVAPGELPAELRNKQSRPLQFAFSSSEATNQPITLSLARATPRVSAHSVTFITASDVLLDYSIALKWEISQAAADRLQFTGPANLKGKLKIEDQRVRQVSVSDLDNDRVRWTLTLNDPVQQQFFMIAQASLPPETEAVDAVNIQFEEASTAADANATALELQSHYAVLINLSSSQLTLESPESPEAVTGDVLPIKVRQELIDQAAEIVRLGRTADAATPRWTIQRFEQQQSSPATVKLARMVTVIASDGTWRGELNCLVKNRNRQFLPLVIPANSSVLSVFVKAKPTRPVQTVLKESSVQLIALPKTNRADLSFNVKVVMRGKLSDGALPNGFQLTAKDFDIPAPRILSQSEDAKFGVPVTETIWTVYLPEEIDAEALEDASRTNLVEGEEDDAELIVAINQLREGVDISSSLTGKMSLRQNYNAFENMQQVQSIAEQYEDFATRYSGNAKLQELSELRGKFDMSYSSNAGKLQIDSSRKTAIVTDGQSNVISTDEEAQRSLIDINNEGLLNSNGIQGTKTDLYYDKSWAYSVNGKSGSPKESKPTAKATEETNSRFSKSNRANDRSGLQRQSVEQLDALNKEIEKNKRQPAQSQDATPEYRIIMDQRKNLVRGFGNSAGSATGGGGMGGIPGTRMGGIAGNGSGAAAQGMPMGGVPGRSRNLPGDLPEFANQSTANFDDINGNGVLDPRINSVIVDDSKSTGVWTQVGGLSLSIDIPKAGQELNFKKVGGSPRLALTMRPQQSLEVGLGAIWTIVWIGLGIGIAIVIHRAGHWCAIFKCLPSVMVALGLLAFYYTPDAMRWVGFFVFLLGALAVGFQNRRVPENATS